MPEQESIALPSIVIAANPKLQDPNVEVSGQKVKEQRHL